MRRARGSSLGICGQRTSELRARHTSEASRAQGGPGGQGGGGTPDRWDRASSQPTALLTVYGAERSHETGAAAGRLSVQVRLLAPLQRLWRGRAKAWPRRRTVAAASSDGGGGGDSGGGTELQGGLSLVGDNHQSCL